MPKSLFLIDGHAQIYRAYYAPFGNLSSPTGEPTRATHVFCQMLLNMVRDHKPDYLVMVLDVDDGTLQRKQVYPAYKAHREPPPEDLPTQEARIIEILEAIRVPILRLPGYEADDVIATLATRMAESGVHTHIVSRDKDLEQLITDNVSLYDPLKDELINAERLYATKGWWPQQAVEAQTLMGDPVDNVPGVVGIGPKTAAKLIQKYGTARAVLEHADELPPKQRENVRAFAPQMDVTRQLVTLHRDLPLDFDVQRGEVSRFRWAEARPIMESLGFRRLTEQLTTLATLFGGANESESAGAVNAEPAAQARDSKPEIPDDDVTAASEQEIAAENATEQPSAGSATSLLAPPELVARLREPDPGRWHLVNTPAAFDAFVAQLAQQAEFAVDTETTGLNPVDADLVGLSFSWKVGEGYYVVVRTMYGEALSLEAIRTPLARILLDERVRKVGHNLKYDLIALRQAGLPVAGPLFDTMIAAFVLDPTRNSYGLDPLVHGLLGHNMIPISDLIGKGRDQLRMDQVPLEQVAEYAAEDADYTWRLKELFEPQLAPRGVDRLFFETEMPLVGVLTEMEYHGIRLDVPYLQKIGASMRLRAGQINEEMQRIVGAAFNPDSPKQLAEILFDKLGFRVVRRTKTARSTDAETLDTLAAETRHPLPTLLLEYREIQKLLGTYVEALPAAISKRTGRVHTSFHQTGAITGRLSSSEPNLQNIPIRTELGREIRRAFVPRSADELLIVADYSQIELRILAHYSGDEELIRAFGEDRDIHAFVAAQVNNLPLEQVTRDMRSRAKAVNFGIIYGQSAFGLARTTGMGRTEAQQFIDDYFKRYPRVRHFIDQCIADAARDGCVRTILGRRRPIRDMDSRNKAVRAQAERLAVNTVMQGSAADLIKTAMLQLHRRIDTQKLPLRLLLQVHDELVCEGPRAEAPRLGAILAEVMGNAMPLRVPLKVDVACGENWLESK